MMPTVAFAAETPEGVWSDFAADSFAGGSGTKADPYQIETAEQLAKVSKDIAENGRGVNYYTDIYFRITDDIDLSAHRWIPIGLYKWDESNTTREDFRGSLDGGGFTVTGLYVDSSTDGYDAGLIGMASSYKCTNPVEIKNIKIVNAKIIKSEEGLMLSSAGILAGDLENNENGSGIIISNVEVSGEIKNTATEGNSFIGGLAGNAVRAEFKDCKSTVKMTGAVNSGGFVGSATESAFENCQAEGSIEGDWALGGFVGMSALGEKDNTSTYSTYKNCYADIDITANDWNIGGFVGYNDYGSFEKCLAEGEITSLVTFPPNLGGFAGTSIGAYISNCYFTGTLTDSHNTLAPAGFIANSVNDSVTYSAYDSELNPNLDAATIFDYDTGSYSVAESGATASTSNEIQIAIHQYEIYGHSLSEDFCEKCGFTIYNMYVGGAQVTTVNAANILGNGTASYNATTNTLTLNGCTAEGTDTHYSPVEAYDDLTVELKGVNNLYGYDGGEGTTAGINVTGNLTIKGDGTLNAVGGDGSGHTSAGISVANGELIIKGGCTVNATAHSAKTYSVGINNESGKVTVDSATLNAYGGDVISGPSSGIYASKIDLKNASVTATGNDTALRNSVSEKPEIVVDYEKGYKWKTASDGTLRSDTLDWSSVGTYFHIEPISASPTPVVTGGGGGSTYYTVNFNSNGGSAVSSKRVRYAARLAKPDDPTRDGYTFAGWYKDSELTQEYDFGNYVSGGFTLYAKWNEAGEAGDGSSAHNCPSLAFNDLNVNLWYHPNTDYVIGNGLMKGIAAKTFAPNANLTRAMLVTVLYREEGEPQVSGESTFADVEPDSWYGKAVAWAQANGIVKGYSATEFKPNQSITREQIAAIMHRYAQYKGYDVSVGENTNILSYTDYSSISEYAISSMQWAVGSGLINGRSATTLNPKDTATRVEIAAILHRFIEKNK